MSDSRMKLSIADVAGWGSALVTFGLVQGALYLQAYWGTFGLNPFQFVAVSEIALAGLAGIGLVLGLMFIAALLGGWLEGRLASISPDRKALRRVASVVLLLGMAAILWWANAWTIMMGGLLTIVSLVVVALSPAVPAAIKNSPWLTYMAVMVIYVSIASSWLGAERAQRVVQGKERHFVGVATEAETLNGLKLIGRLGDTYALWDPARETTVLLLASDLKKLEIMRGSRVEVPNSR